MSSLKTHITSDRIMPRMTKQTTLREAPENRDHGQHLEHDMSRHGHKQQTFCQIIFISMCQQNAMLMQDKRLRVVIRILGFCDTEHSKHHSLARYNDQLDCLTLLCLI